MAIDIQSVLILAAAGIAVWLCLNAFMLYHLRILNREALRDISVPESIVIAGLSYSSAYIIAQLFSRFA